MHENGHQYTCMLNEMDGLLEATDDWTNHVITTFNNQNNMLLTQWWLAC